jgi:hypothetical protein
MKTVSSDKSYIDFTRGNCGVRVWKDRCQAICRANESSHWIGRESMIPLPVADSILGFPHSGGPPTNAVAFEVAQYDDAEGDPELRGVLKGWMTFEQATSEP